MAVSAGPRVGASLNTERGTRSRDSPAVSRRVCSDAAGCRGRSGSAAGTQRRAAHVRQFAPGRGRLGRCPRLGAAMIVPPACLPGRRDRCAEGGETKAHSGAANGCSCQGSRHGDNRENPLMSFMTRSRRRSPATDADGQGMLVAEALRQEVVAPWLPPRHGNASTITTGAGSDQRAPQAPRK